MNMNRNKNLKTIKQLSEKEKNKIEVEVTRIWKILKIIKKDKFNQLKNNEFEDIIKNTNNSLDRISTTKEGYWAKYIVLTNEYVGIKNRNNGIWGKLYF